MTDATYRIEMQNAGWRYTYSWQEELTQAHIDAKYASEAQTRGLVSITDTRTGSIVGSYRDGKRLVVDAR